MRTIRCCGSRWHRTVSPALPVGRRPACDALGHSGEQDNASLSSELRVHRTRVLDKGLQAEGAVKAGWRGPRGTHKGGTSPKSDRGANTAARARAGVPGREMNRAESWWDWQCGQLLAQNWRLCAWSPRGEGSRAGRWRERVRHGPGQAAWGSRARIRLSPQGRGKPSCAVLCPSWPCRGRRRKEGGADAQIPLEPLLLGKRPGREDLGEKCLFLGGPAFLPAPRGPYFPSRRRRCGGSGDGLVWPPVGQRGEKMGLELPGRWNGEGALLDGRWGSGRERVSGDGSGS